MEVGESETLSGECYLFSACAGVIHDVLHAPLVCGFNVNCNWGMHTS